MKGSKLLHRNHCKKQIVKHKSSRTHKEIAGIPQRFVALWQKTKRGQKLRKPFFLHFFIADLKEEPVYNFSLEPIDCL